MLTFASLFPYQPLGLGVLTTLSNGKAAEVVALKTRWPDAPPQMGQVHFRATSPSRSEPPMINAVRLR
jgi:hypothetical protein